MGPFFRGNCRKGNRERSLVSRNRRAGLADKPPKGVQRGPVPLTSITEGGAGMIPRKGGPEKSKRIGGNVKRT